MTTTFRQTGNFLLFCFSFLTKLVTSTYNRLSCTKYWTFYERYLFFIEHTCDSGEKAKQKEEMQKNERNNVNGELGKGRLEMGVQEGKDNPRNSVNPGYDVIGTI